jgi:hypothetical protein
MPYTRAVCALARGARSRYDFTPDVRACPLLQAGHQGDWNSVNTNQLGNFTEALKEEAWVEGVDNLGPRYFFGYLHHFHNAVGACPRRGPCNTSAPGLRHFSISGTDTEKSFLTYRAVEKGLVFTSIWNDYEEACVLEPSINTTPDPDIHSATAGGGPIGAGATFLENVIRTKLEPRFRENATAVLKTEGAILITCFLSILWLHRLRQADLSVFIYRS